MSMYSNRDFEQENKDYRKSLFEYYEKVEKERDVLLLIINEIKDIMLNNSITDTKASVQIKNILEKSEFIK